ncbi:hypothetical protein L3Q82_022599, partial [Scortum barcoo]
PYLPLLTNHRSSSVNGTQESDGITFFIIQGLANLSEKKMILFVILLLGYIIILGGNSMIIFVALTDPKLTSPMFFFLYNLSFVDIVYTTTTIPKMLRHRPYAILTVMAYDRYVAICNPLRYTAIMTRPVRLLLVAGAWGFGAFCTLPATSMAWQRPYCSPNVVQILVFPQAWFLCQRSGNLRVLHCILAVPGIAVQRPHMLYLNLLDLSQFVGHSP